MTALKLVAPAFVEMAHQLVWCVAGTTDTAGKPRTRILHPICRLMVVDNLVWHSTGSPGTQVPG